VCGGGYLWEKGGWVKEVNVRKYGWLTSYTYMKQNNETSCNFLKWSRDGAEGERWLGWSNHCTI
jgi:hypothetical protein